MIINGNCKYTASDGREVDLSEDIRWGDTHFVKYSCAMANYLSQRESEDEWTGSIDWAEYVQRFGKRLLFTDDRGFVTVEKYGSEEEAKERFEEIDQAYGEWLNENDEENDDEY